MKILFAGKLGFTYNRTRILLNGLKKLPNVKTDEFILASKRNFDKKAFQKRTKDVDFIYVPPFRFTDARFLYRQTNIPLIFDPLISTYLTKVIDYKHFWKAPQKYIVDKRSLNSCDILIADTQCHKNYFAQKFKIKEEKIFVLPIGIETDYFHKISENKTDTKFHIGFYGSFVPLQGIHKIIETANLLKHDSSLIFDIIGNGYHFKSVKQLAKKYQLTNVIFHGKLPYKELPQMINSFDICLGIFGDSLKADYVIPNKVYHYSAMNKCTITKDTQGIKELFTADKNIILTPNNPQKIAEKILELKNNPQKTKKIAQNAYQMIMEEYNEIKIAQKFIQILEKTK